tara:strand:+ start:1226 stop:1594 length:369 start_codon:yes stop_codon:yes gene_type:complete
MATYASNQTTSISADIIYDSGVVSTAAVENVTGGTGTWYTIFMKNTDSELVYLHLHDATTLDAGNDEPNWILQCPGSDSVCWTVPDGVTFSNGLSYTASTSAGKTVGGTISTLTMWIVIKRD